MASSSESTPLLRNPRYSLGPAGRGVEKMAGSLSAADFGPCPFSSTKSEKNSMRLPHAIAHRGYKAKFPENTMGAFRGAVEVGAHAIETDVHLTKDDVVVLSHDATLKRCFDKPDKIIECNWNQIKDLQTIKEPRQYMPRLLDLLVYLAEPGQEKTWLLLDIKMDNDPDAIIRLIAKTIESVSAPSSVPWKERIVLGCWSAKYFAICDRYLPGFPVSHIGFSTTYARQFFDVPLISFNMLCPILQGPGGKKFLRDARDREIPVFAWTVNEVEKMEWCIRRRLNGVVTDDPKRFLEVCEDHDDSTTEKWLPIIQILDIIRIWLFALVFGTIYRRKFDKLHIRPQAVQS